MKTIEFDQLCELRAQEKLGTVTWSGLQEFLEWGNGRRMSLQRIRRNDIRWAEEVFANTSIPSMYEDVLNHVRDLVDMSVATGTSKYLDDAYTLTQDHLEGLWRVKARVYIPQVDKFSTCVQAALNTMPALGTSRGEKLVESMYGHLTVAEALRRESDVHVLREIPLQPLRDCNVSHVLVLLAGIATITGEGTDWEALVAEMERISHEPCNIDNEAWVAYIQAGAATGQAHAALLEVVKHQIHEMDYNCRAEAFLAIGSASQGRDHSRSCFRKARVSAEEAAADWRCRFMIRLSRVSGYLPDLENARELAKMTKQWTAFAATARVAKELLDKMNEQQREDEVAIRNPLVAIPGE